jgi:transketolase N-terminal domain/subunit
MGDGEMRRRLGLGSRVARGVNQLNNLVAIVDANRLGQSQATAFGHDVDVYRRRFEAFNWRTEVIDGHDMEEILEVLGAAGLGRQAAGHHRQNLQGRGRFVFAGQGRLARQGA